jgi:hypothetical protein
MIKRPKHTVRIRPKPKPVPRHVPGCTAPRQCYARRAWLAGLRARRGYFAGGDPIGPSGLREAGRVLRSGPPQPIIALTSKRAGPSAGR